MKTFYAAAALSLLLVGCGEKLQEMKDSAEGMQALAEAGKNLEKTATEQEEFMKERRAKGDTVSMSIDEIKAFLPTAIAGYAPKEEPAVSRTDMGEFSYTSAEQYFVAAGADPSAAPQIKVQILDWGGSESGYAFYALPMSLKMSSEDAHQRTASIELDLPYTAGWQEYNKDSKDAKINVVTRYRYLISVEATNQADDQSEAVKALATQIAEKFKDR